MKKNKIHLSVLSMLSLMCMLTSCENPTNTNKTNPTANQTEKSTTEKVADSTPGNTTDNQATSAGKDTTTITSSTAPSSNPTTGKTTTPGNTSIPVITSSPAPSYETTFEVAKASGTFNSAYMEFTKASDVDGYKGYVKANDETSWTQLDNELLRDYGDHFRVDALGLKAGTYQLKIEAIKNGVATKTLTSEDLTVTSYSRDGYAFQGGKIPGAYNMDGTLKDKAMVLYVDNTNASTITASLVTGKNSATTTATGIQSIITLLKKGLETRPIDVRFIGDVKTPADFSTAANESICKGDLCLDGNKKYNAGLTIEGVGNDTYFDGFGVRFKNISNVELRNIGFINCDSDERDDVGLQQTNDHIYVHHCDFFYGNPGKDADQAKGDGALDCKKSNYVTFSYNHFFDNGKCNLLGLSEKQYDLYITYDHNWYDHSDSRHPRVRFYNAHVYNNYFDGNAKYGIGACLGSSIFSEENYFRNCKYPMMVSMQGTDLKNSYTNAGKGMFSSEDGGSIKSYNNIYNGGHTPINYSATNDTDGFDCYEVTSRDDQVPETVLSKQGGNKYSNFDTDASLKDNTNPDSAADVPYLVMTKAGRIENGDFHWTFNNAVDDADYEVNQALKTALKNYKTSLVSVGGLNP